MGVDLATYRARIGSFNSRRNVNCDDEKRKIAIIKERFRLKIDLKAVDSCKPRVIECATINASSSFMKCTLGLDVHVSTKLPMSLLSPKSAHYASKAVAMFKLTLLVAYLLIKQLLILSGDVEMNPGPLGQQGEGGSSPPLLKDLVCLKVPPTKWYQLGLQLNLSEHQLDVIKANNAGNVETCILEMFKAWLSNTAGASYAELGSALNRIGEHSVAAQLLHSSSGTTLSTYNDPSLAAATLPSTESPKGWNKYTRDLKNRYRNHKPAQVDFPPVETYSYVNLALIKDTTNALRDEFFLNTIQGSVDDVVQTKVTISYHDLFSSITPDNRILLLEGRPGCGKTTLTRKISKDWGEETILSFVNYLFLIPLRHFNTKSPLNLHTIMEHFQMTDLEVNIAENGGERVCFVCDGLDEYIKRYSAQGNSWFEQLLRGEVLSCSTIVITSRPNASVELRKTVHVRGEVVGFLTKQIDEYIVKSYPDSSTKVKELQTYLRSHPNIKHMCYVPFNLVMIIFIFNKCHNKTTPLPETETDVYRQFTIMSLIRYFRKENRKIELRDLESLPTPEISMFQIISKLAYTTVIASKTSINPEELRQMCEESSIASLANLGILVVDENEEEYGASHVLTFVHLTHQEFLAAYYASRHSSDEHLKAIREDIVQPHMEVVLKFFCGITKLQNPDHWAAIMDILLADEDGEKKPVTLRALHCVFESQNGQRCRELFSKADGKLEIFNDTLTLLDYSVIGYCLESARDTVRRIELCCQLTAEGLDIITQKLTTMENVKNLKIEDDLCQKEKLLALKLLLQKLPNVESLEVKAASFFEPYQFGVACPRGAERIIHDLRACVEEHWLEEDFVVLKVDMKNAFNQVSHRALLSECAEHFPELLPWVHGPALGLLVNVSMCEVFSHHNLDVFPSGMKASDKPNIVILGVAIGDLDFCSSFISTKRMEARALLSKLEQVGVLDPQVALVLRLCGGFYPPVFQIAVKWWLGLDTSEGSQCTLCLSVLDHLGHHAVTCKYGGDVVSRHNKIRDILVETCRCAHIGVQVEVGNNLTHDHNKTRPADIVLSNWFLGKPAALDVSITSPLNPLTLLEAGVLAKSAAQVTEARKHQANDPKCSGLGWVCVPMVAESYGAWGDEASSIISSIASRLATSTCKSKSVVLNDIYGRLNVHLVRANATAILSRIIPLS
eukprot:Em0001g1739a